MVLEGRDGVCMGITRDTVIIPERHPLIPNPAHTFRAAVLASLALFESERATTLCPTLGAIFVRSDVRLGRRLSTLPAGKHPHHGSAPADADETNERHIGIAGQ
jgi:hypothetical protein